MSQASTANYSREALSVAITLTWNGSIVLEGHASEAAAYEAATAHIRENFAGVEHKKLMVRWPSLDTVQGWFDAGQRWEEAWSDASGRASITVSRTG